MQTVIDGLKIEYIDEGEGQEVLMLHGWGSSTKFFGGIINTLKNRCRVVAVSFPGCDNSDTMENPWVLDDYCDFVLKFMAAVGLKNPILIGHSHGGRVILKLCGTKRLSPPKIVLMGSAGIIPKKSLKKQIKIKSFKLIKSLLSLPVIKNYTAGLLDKARRHFGSADYSSAPEVLRKTMVSLVNTDLKYLLPEISSPTLLIWGENDTDTPLYCGKIMEKGIKDAGLCVIKGGSHFAFLEKPYEVAAILNSFIK